MRSTKSWLLKRAKIDFLSLRYKSQKIDPLTFFLRFLFVLFYAL